MGHPEGDCGDCTVSTPWVPQNYKELELLRQVYYGGVEHEIRKDVWPFLLGHYKFGTSKKEMEQVRGALSRGVGGRGVGPRDPYKLSGKKRGRGGFTETPHCPHCWAPA